jgi:hypothetical protein
MKIIYNGPIPSNGAGGARHAGGGGSTNGRMASRSVFGVDTNLDLVKHGIASKAGLGRVGFCLVCLGLAGLN